MSPAEVLVLGGINMDLVVRVPRAPEAGETLMAHDFITNPGGKGANQAVACARMGGRVAMAGRVGDDAFGIALRAALQADDIDVARVTKAGAPTGVALIMVEDNGENRIAVASGANGVVREAEVEAMRGDIARARLLLVQFEIPMQAVLHAARIARNARVTVVLNPSPARALPAALWPLVDVIVVNESEASALADRAVHDVASAAAAARALRERGPRIAIVTLGASGVVACDASVCRHFPALAVQAVDTTAGGDTFVGALCAALVAGDAIDSAIGLGIRAAGLCVTRHGAQMAIPHRRELDALPALCAPTVLA